MPNEETPSRIISDSEERNGMRTYLQRSEVRLSSIQRVAGLLLNGAGLMILLSTLSSNNLIEKIADLLPEKGTGLISHNLFLFIPVSICLYIPFRFLYILIRELFQFYFADDCQDYDGSAYSYFVLPASVLPSDEVNDSTQKSITLAKGNTSSNRSLVEEVARTELLLARHTFGLRRLVSKYIIALLVLIWTTFVLFITMALFQFVMPLQAQAFVALYTIWGGLTYFLVKHPFSWIGLETSLRSDHPDYQLKEFITEIEIYAVMAIVSEFIFIVWPK